MSAAVAVVAAAAASPDVSYCIGIVFSYHGGVVVIIVVAAGALSLEDSSFSSDVRSFAFSGLALHSGVKRKYLLQLHLYRDIIPEVRRDTSSLLLFLLLLLETVTIRGCCLGLSSLLLHARERGREMPNSLTSRCLSPAAAAAAAENKVEFCLCRESCVRRPLLLLLLLLLLLMKMLYFISAFVAVFRLLCS